MVQIIQITLHEASFKDRLPAGSRALAKLLFGQMEKSFSNFRTIKNEICKFHGERASLSSHNPSIIKRAYIEISVIEGEKSANYGRVEINIEKIREAKDGKRVMMELENNKFELKFQVLASAFDASDIDTKSQVQTILTPVKPTPFSLNLNKIQVQRSNNVSSEKVLTRGSLTERVIATETKNMVGRKQSQQEPPTYSSLNKLQRNISNEYQHSERPVRFPSLKFPNNQQQSGKVSRQSSLKGSIIRKSSIIGLSEGELLNRSRNGSELSMSKRVSFAQKPTIIYEKKDQRQSKLRMYAPLALIAAISFVLGTMVKQI